MESFKPWKEGNPLLWGLSKSDNIHKHQMILPSYSRIIWTGTLEATYANGAKQNFNHCNWHIGPNEHLQVVTEANSIEIDQAGHFSTELLFGGVGPFGELNILKTLHECIRLVDGIVDALEAHFQRGEAAA